MRLFTIQALTPHFFLGSLMPCSNRYHLGFKLVNLANALLEQIQKECRQQNTGLVLVLMPGRSLVERPASQSAQFQEYLGARLVEIGQQQGVQVLDLASHLRAYHQENDVHLFHPHEGHLTVIGHRVTADFIRSGLKASSQGKL